MKLEKRSDGGPEQALAEEEAPPQSAPSHRNKPVVVYIMVLFIVAFLLMALSFFMHQRSNTEAMGKLQSSVSALQEVQATQDENIRLQEELSKAEAQSDTLQDKLDDANAAMDSADAQTAALLALYTLQQQYSAGNYDACKQTIQGMEDSGQNSLLPAKSDAGVTPPAQRYQQLKEAVMSK